MSTRPHIHDSTHHRSDVMVMESISTSSTVQLSVFYVINNSQAKKQLIHLQLETRNILSSQVSKMT